MYFSFYTWKKLSASERNIVDIHLITNSESLLNSKHVTNSTLTVSLLDSAFTTKLASFATVG
jgi:hypothetical protein